METRILNVCYRELKDPLAAFYLHCDICQVSAEIKSLFRSPDSETDSVSLAYTLGQYIYVRGQQRYTYTLQEG